MKVKELKKGMILTHINRDDCFTIYGATDNWVMVRPRPRYKYFHTSKICNDNVMIYLGTKKDIDMKMQWTDRFVLIDNQIVGVDPAAWRKIKPVGQKN